MATSSEITGIWTGEDAAIKYALAERATIPFAQTMICTTKIVEFIQGGNKAEVFDLACGTGAVSAALYEALDRSKWDEVQVLGGDISEPMLAYFQKRAEKEGWAGVRTKIVDAKVFFSLFMSHALALFSRHSRTCFSNTRRS